MSQYADYIFEKFGDEAVETSDGFCTYRYLNDFRTVYIIDIFVKRSKRNSDVASTLADEVVKRAKAEGATELLGSVAPQSRTATASLKVLLAYGMSLVSASPDLIVFRKDI